MLLLQPMCLKSRVFSGLLSECMAAKHACAYGDFLF